MAGVKTPRGRDSAQRTGQQQLSLLLEPDEPAARPVYRLRRDARPGVRGLKVEAAGDVLQVTAPASMAADSIEDALRARLQPTRATPTKTPALPALPEVWAPGVVFMCRGVPLTVRLDDRLRATHCDEGALVLPLPDGASAERIRDQVHAWLQAEAHAVLAVVVPEACLRVGCAVLPWKLTFSSRVVAAADAGVLRLNWKLVLLPVAELERVISRVLGGLAPADASRALFD